MPNRSSDSGSRYHDVIVNTEFPSQTVRASPGSSLDCGQIILFLCASVSSNGVMIAFWEEGCFENIFKVLLSGKQRTISISRCY